MPLVTTIDVSFLGQTSANCGGTITSEGGSSVLSRGVCWGTNATPKITDWKTTDGAGAGSFTSVISGLSAGTKYFARAYATNRKGTGYGMIMSFTTLPATTPSLATSNITNITQTTAICGGNISSDGAASITNRGVCWSTAINPTTADNKTSDGTGTGTFTSNLTGLTGNSGYYVRAYAINSAGTSYGDLVRFVTGSVVPTLSTTAVSSITQTTATSGGNIISDGGGTITASGICWNTTTGPTTTNSKTTNGTTSGIFSGAMTGLQMNTKYFVKAFATNSAGTAYGNEVSFTTGQIVLATLTTTEASSITLTTAVSGGNITDNGGGTISTRGVCWATTATPTTSNFITSVGTGTGIFASGLTGLQPGTTYHLRAYATNEAGTAYGNEITFLTSLILIPTLTTAGVTSITLTTATSGGIITADGGASVTGRGVCWATYQNPTITDSKSSDATGIGIFASNLSALMPGTIYHVRSYATNSAGTAYGNDVSFTTSFVALATVTTTALTSINLTTAVSGGNITVDGGGAVSARGVCWATTANPIATGSHTTDGTGTGSFVSNLTLLAAGTTYHVRAYATNSAGTAYGNDLSFTTSPASLPTLTTAAITSNDVTTAVSGGNITADGGAGVTVRGVCWSTIATPTITDNLTTNGTGTGSFISNLTGLTAGTTYYLRAYATNNAGTAYGNQIRFNTKIADIDGNTYNIVHIGTQVWMAENLKTTKYNDFSTVPLVTNASTWTALLTPGYCWYNNDETTYKSTYGTLYNWYAVNAISNGGKNVCPIGWHVPSDAQWTILTDYLTNNGYGYGGNGNDIAKSMAFSSGWLTDANAGNIGNDQGSNNSSGFSAVPGGFRSNSGTYGGTGYESAWWSSTEFITNYGLAIGIYSYFSTVAFRGQNEAQGGLSVRCLKD
jgi:uncharacterized protein (TIGR02145 family)